MKLTITLKDNNCCVGCPCLNYQSAMCKYFGLAISNVVDYKTHTHTYERPEECKRLDKEPK